jgi:hypothetical protein
MVKSLIGSWPTTTSGVLNYPAYKFVSYQAIRTYLEGQHDAEYTPAEPKPFKYETANVRISRSQTVSVSEGKLEQLRNSGELTLSDFRQSPKFKSSVRTITPSTMMLYILATAGMNVWINYPSHSHPCFNFKALIYDSHIN